jgi:hypothetical protein
MHVYEVRLRKDHRGVGVLCDVLPFGRLWYDTLDNAICYAMHSSRSKDAVIRVYDDAGNVIEAHEHAGDASTEVSASGPVGPTLPRPSSPASKNGELVV